ncbi:MAG: PTS sugar transporter subunit IIA, partial [Lactiplantibacillus plantarum]|nr:PTS sugar transporter subunit IIA [Lactiplantibacillus plantarum]
FSFIAHKAIELGFADNEDAVLKALYQREKEASTGMQDGIAIPHAISEYLRQPAVLFIRSTTSIQDWPTFDDQPVNQVIAMLVPKNSEQAHLQILANFASALVDDRERQALLESQTVQDVYTVLTNSSEKIL